jgi:hypothetical protein
MRNCDPSEKSEDAQQLRSNFRGDWKKLTVQEYDIQDYYVGQTEGTFIPDGTSRF